MDLKYGDKLSLKGLNLEVEVKGILPQGQPVMMTYSDDRVFNVLINGRHNYIKESVLQMLVDLSVEPKEDIVDKRKPGRPPKGE